MIYGVHQPVLVFWSLPIGVPVASETTAALQFGFNYLDVFLQLLIALGMLLWMLEVEREGVVDWRRLTESEERYRTLAETRPTRSSPSTSRAASSLPTAAPGARSASRRRS